MMELLSQCRVQRLVVASGGGCKVGDIKKYRTQRRRLSRISDRGVYCQGVSNHRKTFQKRTQLFCTVDKLNGGSNVNLPENEVQETNSTSSSNGHVDLIGGKEEELSSRNIVQRVEALGENGGVEVKGAQHERDQGLWNKEATSMIILLSVALLWGTYVPSLKYLLSLPGPPAPSVLMAVKSVIATCLLQIGVIISKRWNRKDSSPLDERKAGGTEPKQVFVMIQKKGFKQIMQRMLTWSSASLIICGCELGLWNFLASSAQAIGLQYTSATRTAFLIQSTALFTPLVALAAGDQLTRLGWIGCIAGLLGSIVVTMDSKTLGTLGSFSLSLMAGDALVLGAAFIYAIATVRLATYAQQFDPVEIAASRTNAATVISLLWFLWDYAGCLINGQPASSLWMGYASWQAWIVLFWAAIGPSAMASVLQAKGQQLLGPAQAQVFYASTPFWSALIAATFLTGESMGILGWVGGSVVILGGVASSIREKENK